MEQTENLNSFRHKVKVAHGPDKAFLLGNDNDSTTKQLEASAIPTGHMAIFGGWW